MVMLRSFGRAARLALLGSATLGILAPAAVRAQGDLLVAPTRVVLNGAGRTEVILSNIGAAPATYRIALEVRRMTPEGDIDDVPEADFTASEKAALAMVRYAPRRITLQPNQPQSVRISARPGAELPDGEYRVHVSFKAIPDPTVAAQALEQNAQSGLTIRLTPIYGLTIPMIVRKGQLEATAAIANPRLSRKDNADFIVFDLQRSGTRSVYGDITVAPRGGKPVFEARGFAVYPELSARSLSLQLTSEQAAKLRGPVRIEYKEPADAGGKLIAALDADLR